MSRPLVAPPVRSVRSVRLVRVVIPVHDEEERLGACLDSVATAARALTEARPAVDIRTLVVLDRCTDASAEIAAAAGVDTVRLEAGPVGAGSVGAARRLGVDRVEIPPQSSPERVWIASTDADTVVCPAWLVDQVRLADLGHDLVLGRVRPDPTELSGRALAAWHARHDPGDAHVHGANLGVRLSAYRRVGGFPAIAEHEDVALAEAVRAAGLPWTTGSLATTSARMEGRTPGGFAGYLRTLALDVDSSEPA